MEIRGDDQSTDEVILQPGFVANWLRFPGTRAEHRARGEGGVVEVAGGPPGTFGPSKRSKMPVARAAVVSNGEWHRLANTGSHPLTVHVTLKPSWNPKRAEFRLGDRQFRGDEVWFEVKTHIADRTARAMYQLHDLSAKQGNVSVRLAPGIESIETFHKGATVVITGVEGSGVVRIDGKPQDLKAAGKVTVRPGQRYQLQNPTRQPFQVNQVHEPQWEPADTFYVHDKLVIPGSQVWFEFVVPD
jgi:mannose-6-phosphate isomerase-like protein (cupin superfamily)